MNTSYLRRAGSGTLQDFSKTFLLGMQDYAERLSTLVRGVPPEDYAMLVVCMEDLAKALRTATPEALQTSVDGMRLFLDPSMITMSILRKETEP